MHEKNRRNILNKEICLLQLYWKEILVRKRYPKCPVIKVDEC